MSAGNDMLKQTIGKALDATKDAVEDGVCKQHDSIRLGVNALLMCQQSELEERNEKAGFWIGKIGPFDRRDGYRLCLVIIVAYAALVAYGKAPLPGPDIFERLPQSESTSTL